MRIIWPETPRANDLQIHITIVLKAIGITGAWVSDQAVIGDYQLSPNDESINERISKASIELGIPIDPSDLVVDVAERLMLKI